MRMSWLLCVLSGTLAWGQAAPGTPPPAQAAPAGNAMQMQAPPQAAPDTSASVPATAAVITVEGVCPAKPKTTAAAAKPAGTAKAETSATPPAECKTVITKAEFEKLAAGVAPNITPQQKKQLAGLLPRLIAMSDAAKKKGLDKTPQFDETVKFAKMQILTNELQRKVQADASKIPDAEIADYFKKNPEAFEQYNLERLFVPRTKQVEGDAKEEDEQKDEKLSDEAKKTKEAAEKAKNDAAEAEMTKLAETLRARAAAGEDFTKLQKEAFEAAGMKIEAPTVNLPKVRRTGLPPAHAAVFELKAGEVSQVIGDSGGHYIYKVNSKDLPTLDQVKDEIHSTLQNQKTRDAMEKLNGSFKAVTNDAYFGPGGVTPGLPPRRGPNPHMAPGPMGTGAPAPQSQPAQPPAANPN